MRQTGQVLFATNTERAGSLSIAVKKINAKPGDSLAVDAVIVEFV